MRLASCLRWIAGFLTLALSSPPKRRLSFNLQHTPRSHVTSRWHDTDIADARRLRGGKTSFECDLKNYFNIEYHLIIEIGKPCDDSSVVQQFRVVPDTGSADLWVPATNCSTCPVSAWKYNMKKSCSASPVGVQRQIKYGDGTGAKGTTLIDSIKIGDLQVDHQPLIQVDEMLDASTLGKVDGILGLAHHYDKFSNNTDSHSLMETLYREHPHVPRMFSFYLAQAIDDQSQIIFGDPLIEKHAKSAEFIYGKAWFMAHTDLWLTSVYSIGLARTDVEKMFETSKLIGGPALVDSGSSLIVLVPHIWRRMIDEIGNQLGKPCNAPDVDGATATCDCSGVDIRKLPELVINLIDENDREVPLCMAPWEYIQQTRDIFNKTTCTTSLQRGNNRQPVPLIFGMAFMQTFYTNFDLEHHRIGFARSKKSTLPANSMCNVHSQEYKKLWWVGGLLSAIAFSISCYIICTCCWEIKCCKDPCPGGGVEADGYTLGVTETRKKLDSGPSNSMSRCISSETTQPLTGESRDSVKDGMPNIGEIWKMNGKVETVTVFEDESRTKVLQDLDCRPIKNGNPSEETRVAILQVGRGSVLKIQWATFNSGRKKFLSGWIQTVDRAGNLILDKVSDRSLQNGTSGF
jgi:hypothetical protein